LTSPTRVRLVIKDDNASNASSYGEAFEDPLSPSVNQWQKKNDPISEST
jgi:hypothetical protein